MHVLIRVLFNFLEPNAWRARRQDIYIITSSTLFDEKNIMYENWVQGNQYIMNDDAVMHLPTEFPDHYDCDAHKNTKHKTICKS